MAFIGTSRSLRILLHDLKLKGLICGLKKIDCWTCRIGAKRHLLSEDVIRLQEFQKRKLAVAYKYGENGEYLQRFKQKLEKNDLILKEELKLLLHLCQTPKDMIIAKNAIHRYHEENRNVSFGEFKFGPVFMRLCYEHSLEEMAANTVMDKALRGFFSDSTSFNIVMDMLFTKGCYERNHADSIETASRETKTRVCRIAAREFVSTMPALPGALEVLIDMRRQEVPFNKDSFTMASGICYKLNTPKSYKVCTALLTEAQTKGHLIPRHAYCFAIALALKQDDNENAKSLYSQIMSNESRICQNLQVLILAKDGAMKDILSILTSAVVLDRPAFVKKPEFSHEVVSLVRQCSEDSPVFQGRVSRVLTKLQESGQVSGLSVDEMLCHTPGGKRKPVGVLLEPRKTSRRTHRPLQSSLLAE